MSKEVYTQEEIELAKQDLRDRESDLDDAFLKMGKAYQEVKHARNNLQEIQDIIGEEKPF